jgi:hypothetical protein
MLVDGSRVGSSGRQVQWAANSTPLLLLLLLLQLLHSWMR